ncbi:MAG: AraC family transcriptional regulator [Burkholderiales bacterium]|nr:AraC family transcriptional regulator [Burkholderiales bacterium]
MARTIKTYSMLERVEHADFDIHTEHDLTSVEREHRHEYFQLQLHLAGRTEHRIGARVLALEPGSLCFVLPYRVHHAGRTPGSKFFVINFETHFLRPALAVDPLDLEDVPLGRAPELAPFLFQEYMDFRLRGAELALARGLCAEMALENARRGFCSLEIIHAHLVRLLATVCRRHEGELLGLAAERAQVRSRRDALSRVLRYIRQHVGTRISLTESAAAAHLSPNYLTHLLKKETGRTFVELVTARRMEKARELLSRTALRVTDIAAAVGFEDAAYFTRRFRQHFHAGPREYRNRASSTGGAARRGARARPFST